MLIIYKIKKQSYVNSNLLTNKGFDPIQPYFNIRFLIAAFEQFPRRYCSHNGICNNNLCIIQTAYFVNLAHRWSLYLSKGLNLNTNIERVFFDKLDNIGIQHRYIPQQWFSFILKINSKIVLRHILNTSY